MKSNVGDLIAQGKTEEALHLMKTLCHENNFITEKQLCDKLLGEFATLKKEKSQGLLDWREANTTNSKIVVAALELKDEIANMLKNQIVSQPNTKTMARGSTIQLFFNCIQAYVDIIEAYIFVFPEITGELKMKMAELLELLYEYTGCTDPARMENIPLEIEDHFTAIQKAGKQIHDAKKNAELDYEKEAMDYLKDSVPSWEMLRKSYDLINQHITLRFGFPVTLSADASGIIRRTLKQQLITAIKQSK